MASKKKAAPDASTIDGLTAQIAAMISALPLEESVAALNRVRAALHDAGPFAAEPVDLVTWVKSESVDKNDYNPNRVAPPEMRLLQHSIEADGYTQPIVSHETESGDVTVDGFHRGRCGKEVQSIRERVHGYLPVARIKGDRSGRADRIAATVRHNRARGVHGVDSMSEIVRMLYVAGWTDDKIQVELGMQASEVVRLKQITGLAALFADRDFSEAWEAIQ